jgi:2-oxoglutarate dehydrogenase E1 component
MADTGAPKAGINSWLEDELRLQYEYDEMAVDQSWKEVFNAGKGEPAAPPAPVPQTAVAAEQKAVLEAGPSEQLVPLRGAAARIAENMAASLAIPLATSQRIIPVKVIDENRRIINQHRTLLGHGKISYTHIIGWAILKALENNPALNQAYVNSGGEGFRLVRNQVNLGIAVDVAGRDGSRSLMVPSIKEAGRLNFFEYLAAFDDIVVRARAGKLQVADFQGTTISLTNPGTVGTVASVPRLMPGQGCIIATGAIDYPPEYQGVTAEMRALLGISKVMSVTCTYDHRIIQGAESGMFLARLEALLQGEDGFYERIFLDLRMPHQPVRWEPDRQVARSLGAGGLRSAEVAKEASVLQLINAYRVRGHLIADFDPLVAEPSYHPELDPAHYGLTIWDLDREFITGSLGQAIGEGAPHFVATLREILETLRQTYCGKIGCEYMNIQHPEQKQWLQQRMEPTANNWPLDPALKTRILERLIEAESFENFLHTRFVGHKRFSLEGAEAAIAILDELLDRAANNSVHEIVIGMAHRGRLNVLTNIIGKPASQVFSEFEGVDPDSTQGSGDVKYHLGASGLRRSTAGREIVVSVAPNPSHLEAVDPVVEGIVRPKQDRLGDARRERVIPVLIHGDAAFAGQGVVAETLNLSQLDGYTTGGTIHLIINNQIGFTTSPEESRSTPYSTDVARMVQAPIFHVNGDDPEACIRVTQLAFDYRQRFKKDVVIDMFCYRRHGHNEGDDPSFTQPLLYKKIRQHPSVAALYSERLIREKILGREDVERMRKAVVARLEDAYEAAKNTAEKYELQELAVVGEDAMETFCPHTAVDRASIEKLIQGLTTFPEGFHLHPKLKGFFERRGEVLNGGPIDWAMAEALAFGSLVTEGTPVRLSGQDSSRGTFSQRHLDLVDNETEDHYCPLKHLSPNQARFDVFDSSLSEYAVLGFEFGYSVGDPLTLVLWEAQFGDFANGAQIMIDQFIACAEQKWGQPSGLVMLLPHGQEGQGPEHSSARMERFLVLCAENNMQIINCTTPAQYFHVLRRQMHGGRDRRGMRKPMVIFTPKSILRHPKAVSSLKEVTSGSFREVIGDSTIRSADRVERVVLCTGKIYYELLNAREEKQIDHVAIVRLEQIHPFPQSEIQDVLLRYPITSEVVWVQEEPRNMGAWRFVREHIQPLLDSTRRVIRYVGRQDSASPAPGSLKRHQQEHHDILEAAFAAEAVVRRKVRVVARRKAN